MDGCGSRPKCSADRLRRATETMDPVPVTFRIPITHEAQAGPTEFLGARASCPRGLWAAFGRPRAGFPQSRDSCGTGLKILRIQVSNCHENGACYTRFRPLDIGGRMANSAESGRRSALKRRMAFVNRQEMSGSPETAPRASLRSIFGTLAAWLGSGRSSRLPYPRPACRPVQSTRARHVPFPGAR